MLTSGTYPWSFVMQMFHSDQPSHGGDRKTFEVMTLTYQRGNLNLQHNVCIIYSHFSGLVQTLQ